LQTSTTAAPPRALISPLGDILLGGGFSILAIAILYFAGPRPFKGHDYGTVFLFGILLNWPHFIASYWLLYRNRAQIARYRAASTWVPLLLVAWCIAGLIFLDRPAVTNSLIVVGSVYLARHYTGQTWGMMASYSYLSETPFADIDRRLIKISLNLLMVWHGLWALTQSSALISTRLPSLLIAIGPHLTWLRICALVIGGAGLVTFARRHKRLPPARVLAPWVALNVWYAAMAEDNTMLFAAQLGHALQYLAFPMRIQMNRGDKTWRAGAVAYLIWTVIGLGLFEGLEPFLTRAFSATGGAGPLPQVAATLIITAVSIHHYFVDGALYKLRNPEVRADLFSHVTGRGAQ
jgi:hypothetical protein